MDPVRRVILQGSVAIGSLFLPVPCMWVWAQSEGTLKLMRLPKVALVMGNGAYQHVPGLTNPSNDAQAIAEVLKKTGFEVTLKLNASRTDMLALIQSHVRTLKEKNCVGIFYYAGHGMQIAWRNYLVPVEAMIHNMDDVPKQCVEVGNLLEGLTAAANPINLIILDACRHNPFGMNVGDTPKGLSQMDAPPATLLAYATAPGNVASDGDGANGLYTEHLLKEIQVRETKIEDIFKRVRLGVRRQSNGAQIPWESTSLEDDFYFLPPEQFKELTDAEQEAEFQEQLTIWEKIKNSRDPAALTEFLTRYPSSHFSELAHQQLDRLLANQGEKKIRIAAAEGNPFTKGTANLDTHSKVGDSYTYQFMDPDSRAVRRTHTIAIKEITDTQVIFDNGVVTDLQGNTLRMNDGRMFTDNQNVPIDFEVGKQWTTRYRVTSPQGVATTVEMNYVISSRGPVTVPAGTFNAFLIEGFGIASVPRGKVETIIRFWWDPQHVRRPIAKEEIRQIHLRGSFNWRKRRPGRQNKQEKVRVISAERLELVSYKQS